MFVAFDIYVEADKFKLLYPDFLPDEHDSRRSTNRLGDLRSSSSNGPASTFSKEKADQHDSRSTCRPGDWNSSSSSVNKGTALTKEDSDTKYDQKKFDFLQGDGRSSTSSVPVSALSKENVLRKLLKEWTEEEIVFGVVCFSVDNDLRRKYSFQAAKIDADDIYERLTYNGFGAPSSKSIIISNDNKFCEGCVVKSHEETHNSKPADLVECLKSIQSKLTVHEVLANVRAKGQMSLDSVFQVITAGMIAMTGLAMDDPVIVVASMFIAPLMDVINMVTFAIRINSREDIVMGSKTFFLYIGIMMTMALSLGKPMQEWSKFLNFHMYDEASFAYPTKQMTNRGHFLSLVGVFVLAVCSSLSSYSSMLNGYNFNVHIGNAISLSLVPPVMNCGMMLVFGMDTAVRFSNAHVNSTDPCLRAYALCDVHDTNPVFNSSLAACIKTSQTVAGMTRADCWFLNQPKICSYPRVAFFEALISLSITFLTALVVIIMGLALMWLKKFTPTRLDKNHVAEFYKNDLDVYVQNDRHSTVRRRSNACFINGLRSELMSNNLSESDCEIALQLAQRTEHFKSVTAGLGSPSAFSITKMETQRSIFGTDLHRRTITRQVSDNQRTIYDTFVPGFRRDLESNIPEFDNGFVGDRRITETSPLRTSESVGRFHITCPEKV